MSISKEYSQPGIKPSWESNRLEVSLILEVKRYATGRVHVRCLLDGEEVQRVDMDTEDAALAIEACGRTLLRRATKRVGAFVEVRMAEAAHRAKKAEKAGGS